MNTATVRLSVENCNGHRFGYYI